MEYPQRLSDLTARYETIESARALTTWVVNKGLNQDFNAALDMTRAQLGPRSSHVAIIEKSATAAVTSLDAGLDELRPLTTAWADLVRRRTLIGRMVGVRFVPWGVPITVVDAGMVAGFVTDGAGIPVVKPTLTDSSLTAAKIGVITPYSNEIFRKTAGRAATLLERDQSRAVAVAEDSAALDGAAAVVGGRPASWIFGVSPLTGESPADLDGDVLAMLGTVRGGDSVAPYFITSPAGALALIAARNDNGHRLFPDVQFNGGAIHGVPLLVSTGAPDSLVLIDADALLVYDGGVEIDIARYASFQFDTAPTNNSATGTGSSTVSLFQTNCFAVRTVRTITWRLAWSDAVAYVNLRTGSPS